MEENEALSENVCRDGNFEELFQEYIFFCYKVDEDDTCSQDKRSVKKSKKRFPNMAGFCRYIGVSESEYERLCGKYPESFDRIKMSLEDEALNADVSPTIISAYMKKRLGYEKNTASEVCDGQLKIVFEHDILEDGI